MRFLPLVVAVWGCGSESREASSLSWQAIAATLATQETIEFNEEAALEFQRQTLDRCWNLEPLLECVFPTPPWELGILLTRAVPPDVQAAWDQGTPISSNEAMNRLVEEFGIVGVRRQDPGEYLIQFGPTPIEVELYRDWDEEALLRMDRLADRLNQDVEDLEVVTMEVPLRGSPDALTWSQDSFGRSLRWEWAGHTVDGLGVTFWDCRVPNDPEGAVDLEISGDAPSYAAIDQCIEGIESGRFPL